MPRKLRRGKEMAHRGTPEAVSAWCEADYMRLHQALGLRPWQPSPLPLDVEPLGVDPDWCPEWEGALYREHRQMALALQRELRRQAGRDPVGSEEDGCHGS